MWKWILIALGVVVLIVLLTSTGVPSGISPNGSGKDTSAYNSASLPATSVAPGNNPQQPIFATQTTVGTQGAGASMGKQECRNHCRGVCGGRRPLSPITKKGKAMKQCHDNCRGSYCRWYNFAPSED